MGEISKDEQAKLVSENQGLVVSLAKYFNPPNHTELDEYKQVGNIGLWKASLKYDPERSKFSTLAWYCIRNEIIRYIKQQSRNKVMSVENDVINSLNCERTNWHDSSELFPSTLTEKEQDVLVLRSQGYTFEEIGKKLGGLSKGGAGNIYKKALNKVRIANFSDEEAKV